MESELSSLFRKKKNPTLRVGFRSVPKVGIEPTHLAIHDFESCASTNSATLACVFKIGLQI
jgi:hypothetical protein